MKGSEYIAAFLAEQGVQVVYEMAGGMITRLLDSMRERGDIRIVSMHHEQAAAFAAEGGARVTGVPGVAMATSGPGATNLITGIGSCYFDSVPAVFITGQVNTFELKGDSGVRQSGFQETDIVELVRPITKAAFRIDRAQDVPELMGLAFRTALEGRPGPVLVDVPMDVQAAEVQAEVERVTVSPQGDLERVAEVLAALVRASRPLMLVGGGVRSAQAASSVLALAEAMSVPVVHSLMGSDVLPYAHPLRAGLIGTYGNRWANTALRDCDCLLVLGARLDVRQIGADIDAFTAEKTLLRVDIDEAQLHWRVPAAIEVRSDVGVFAREAVRQAEQVDWPDRSEWLASIHHNAQKFSAARELAGCLGTNPATLMQALSEAAAGASAFVTDVGQNQMWAAQSLRIADGQRLITSGGMGAMGFALPAAIGVAIAAPGKPVVAIAGDGGMQVNIQELESIVRLGLPVKIVVLNNRCLGMVRQFQGELFDSRYQSTVWGYGAPDFVRVAEAYGIPARACAGGDDIEDALAWLMRDPTKAGLIDVCIDPGTSVRPKVSFGDSVFVMDRPSSIPDGERR